MYENMGDIDATPYIVHFEQNVAHRLSALHRPRQVVNSHSAIRPIQREGKTARYLPRSTSSIGQNCAAWDEDCTLVSLVKLQDIGQDSEI